MAGEARQWREDDPESEARAAQHAAQDAKAPSSPSTAPEENPLLGLGRSLLKWSAVLVTLGGLILHLVGYVQHSEYLRDWGLDSDLFPKSIEWILISGYQVMLLGMIKLWVFFKTQWWKLAIWGVTVATLTSVVSCLLLYGKDGLPVQSLWNWAKKFPKWLLATVLCYGYVACVCVVIAVAPIVTVTFIFLPAWIAFDSAKTSAEQDKKLYAQGCDQADLTKRCITVRRENKPDLRGFLIDSSDSLLAIYVPDQKVVQVIPRDGIELEVSLSATPKAGKSEQGRK
ncbi:hypothetical protein [Uliginosibacterium sp. TH139]|uniref:hypothetical protein n=1 Tax=Uliginosibacterium sp. TH139 TaxID=2067453 RepID=UPI000C7B7F10|nr:hypothetical protein [Uliginosibacterium sp. TH139]PLK49689.1 hypothetical protein C0V76_04460 [Uliginosibacterium sp. TH139]